LELPEPCERLRDLQGSGALVEGAYAPVAQLAVPAGNYLVVARGAVWNRDNDALWLCHLRMGDASGTIIDWR
jgi:hypothetical protein